MQHRRITTAATFTLVLLACGGSQSTAPEGTAHAPGGPSCDELAKACHDVGHSDDEAGKCHQMGHAGDAAVCEKEHQRCLAVCKQAASSGGHDGAGHQGH